MTRFALNIVLAILPAAAICETAISAEWGEVSKTDQKVLDALNKPVDWDFKAVPLDELVKLLEERHKIEIDVNARILEANGIREDAPVTLKVKGIQLQSALRMILHQVELRHIVADGIIEITTDEDEELDCRNRIYPIDDLVSDDHVTAVRESVQLIEAIRGTVMPEFWDWVGGPCSIRPIPPGKPTALLVRANYRTHEGVAELLEMLRKAAAAKPEAMPVSIFNPPGPAEAKLLKALDSPAKFDFSDTPLVDIAEQIEKQYGINVVIDDYGLDRLGFPPSTPFTLEMEGVSLRIALKRMLRGPEFAFLVQDDVLLITTGDEAAHRRETRVYPLRNVMPQDETPAKLKKRERYVADLDYTIRNNIAPASWDSVGGSGSTKPLLLEKQDVLVVFQTQEVHREIGGLLSRKDFRRAEWVRPIRNLEQPPKVHRGYSGKGMGMM